MIEQAFHVVCLWERPGAETLAARIASLGLHASSVIVVYLAPLTLKNRQQVLRQAKNQHLSIAVLDECLLAFLALERDARYPVFLRCSLPFSTINPYTPNNAGDVPPEIFFGRTEMARAIEVEGSSIVYGGRQLGKSALLRHVERSFHRPSVRHFAFVEEISQIGKPEYPTATLWIRLQERLKEAGLLSKKVRSSNPDHIQKHIARAVSDPEVRVLALLDVCKVRWRPGEIGVSRDELRKSLEFAPTYMSDATREKDTPSSLRTEPITGARFDALWEFLVKA